MKKLTLLSLLILLSTLPAQAGLSPKVGTFQSGTGAGASTITFDPGFVPKVIKFWTSFQPGMAANANSSISYGFATSQDGATFDQQRVMWTGCIQVDSSVCKSRPNNALVVMIYTGTVSFAIAGSLSATSISGSVVTLTVGTQFAADTTIHYEARGGTDLTNWGIVTMTQKTSAGSFTDTNLGFKPDFAEFVMSKGITNNTQANDSNLSIGFSDGTNSALAATYAADAQTASITSTYVRGAAAQTDLIAEPSSGTGVNIRDSFTSFGSSSPWITLNCDENAGGTAPLIYVLAFKGARWHVGTYQASTANSTLFNVTDGAWTPVGIGVVAPFVLAQSTSDVSVIRTSFGFGATDGTTAGSATYVAQHNDLTNLLYFNKQSSTLLYDKTSAADNSDVATANFTAFLSNGWSATTVTGSASHTFGIYYSFAANAVGGTTPPRKAVIY